MTGQGRLFRFMSTDSKNLWLLSKLFLFVLPIIWIIFISIGFNEDDIIEDDIAKLWIPTSSNYAKDKDYANNLGMNFLSASTFLGMSLSRDGENIFTSKRLDEIRTRMEKAESTIVEHKTGTYTWDDLCYANNAGVGSVYKFPCLRVSPMDYFVESNWFFQEDDKVTWYDDIIQDKLVKPLIPRFGIMSSVCSSNGGDLSKSNSCDLSLALRTNATIATMMGYPLSYVNPMMLFSDINNMENSNECKICIEQGYVETVNKLQQGIVGNFGVMALELQRSLEDTTGAVSDEAKAMILDILPKVGKLAKSITRQDVMDYYHYMTVRQLYAQLGMEAFLQGYNGFTSAYQGQCPALKSLLPNATCDTLSVLDVTDPTSSVFAMTSLLNHADSPFSSLSTAGNALPIWSSSDDDGNNDNEPPTMFGGTSPIGGSGIDLTGTTLQSMAYFNTTHYGTDAWSPLYGSTGGFVDPTVQQLWGIVEGDPTYKWFMSSLEPMVSHCSNDNLPGTGLDMVDNQEAFQGVINAMTKRWCTKYNEPYDVDGQETKQHFAKMWYDLLVDSDGFLGLTKGISDPYTWTTGQGCGYSLAGSRYSYTGDNDTYILGNASRELYYIDEGVSIGAIDRNLLIGGTTPHIGSYNFTNPLQEVKVIQTIYPTAIPKDIVNRVKNCNRPNGSLTITEDDATEILELWKEQFELSWTEGWDNNDNDNGDDEVQFVGFYDSVGGAIGTTGRTLRDITLDNGKLTAIAICVIAAISALFLFSFDMVESRVLVTLIGVGLVLICFFGALGFGIIVGIKININIAWTLPFIILGLGVDDMYIVLLALKKRQGYSRRDFVTAMTDVVVPITMTSLVNASMFAIMNISDIPAITKTAQVAMIAIIFLWLTIIFCYPAWCWLDFQRQASGRYDIFFCFKKNNQEEEQGQEEEQDDKDEDKLSGHDAFLYSKIYKPLVFGESPCRILTHLIVWLGMFALLGVGIWGINEREVGLGLEDFFPKDHQAHIWATVRTEELAAWSIQLNWGDLDYSTPETQMKMIGQFEGVIGTPHVAEMDTKFLWIADFLIWTTRHCTENFSLDDPDVFECGRDQVFLPNNTESEEYDTTCSGIWVNNTFNLREKNFPDPRSEVCSPYEGGICRSTKQMHFLDLIEQGLSTTEEVSYCPVVPNWSDEKMAFCLQQWRKYTGGGGSLILVDGTATPTNCSGEYLTDDEVEVPILYSKGPSMYAFDLNTHDDTLDLIEQTRAFCDDDPELRCWLTGIPYDYWEQYLDVDKTLLKISGYAILLGFVVAVLFLFSQLQIEQEHSIGKIITGSAVGGLLIAVTIILCIVPVVGISSLANVNVTGFSVVSYVLSVAFSTEYSVHIVHRFLESPLRIDNAMDRIQHTMQFLTLPLTLAFISSTVGIICLAFTEFEFNTVFFFRPLIIVMGVTYFIGVWWLPIFLSNLNFDFLKLGKSQNTSYYYGEGAVVGSSVDPAPIDNAGAKEIDEKKEVDIGQKSIEVEDASSSEQEEVDDDLENVELEA